jgi:DNA-binding LacI/PurR family transcriptional regulator
MAQKVTVYDVAELAGVSIATVSFAFTRPEKVKPDTVRAVMVAADTLGYVPSASARGLARGRTGAIGLYAYDYLLDSSAVSIDDDSAVSSARLFPLYADEVQRGVQLECRDRGYALMIGGNRTPNHLPHVIEVAGRVDGLIAFAGALSAAHLRQVASRIPVVELGGEVREPGTATVLVDNRQGMADLTHHLLKTHHYKRFAYLGELGTPEFRQRWEGFSTTLIDAEISVPEVTPSHPGDDASTVAAVEALLDKGELPEVLVCDTDQSALVAIAELKRHGLTVPRDIAVTGFDGILAGQLNHPPLTTVRQPMEEIGRLAVSLLVDVLGGGKAAEQADPLISSFMPGQTCGCS